MLDLTAPKLTREEELFAISLGDLVGGLVGKNAATVLTGDALLEPDAVAGLLLGILASGRTPLGNDERLLSLAKSTQKQLQVAETTSYDVEGPNEDGGFDELLDAVNDLTPEEKRGVASLWLRSRRRALGTVSRPLVSHFRVEWVL